MRLITACLAKNEASEDRYLRRVLTRCREFSDAIVLLDDHSTDATPDIAHDMGCLVQTRQSDTPAWGNESSARRELWELACSVATGPNDWVLINDADQELRGDVRGLCKSVECNTWNFVLYDCWSPTDYRTDGHWQAHTLPRPWLFAPNRVTQGWTPEWSGRGIHVGHCPINWPAVGGVAPPDEYYWLHWGWSKPEHRLAKYQQYKAQYAQMTPFEIAHAESIVA